MPNLEFKRYFSSATPNDPISSVKWVRKLVTILDASGKVLFKEEIEAPDFWSDTAIRIVASRYLYLPIEKSIKQLLLRVCTAIAARGYKDGYFSSDQADIFRDELIWLCLHQYGAFNSPVWFNMGLFEAYNVVGTSVAYTCGQEYPPALAKLTKNAFEYPQISACFIQSVKDDLADLLSTSADMAQIFRYGSGTGMNLSPIRGSEESLSNGGTPAGPLGFIRLFDQIASMIRASGKIHRAALMQILNVSHPDIYDFINSKYSFEAAAAILLSSGVSDSFLRSIIPYQNVNLSVRATDEFMYLVLNGDSYSTSDVMSPHAKSRPFKASDLLHFIAEKAWQCGDPGIQFHDTINKWHTCPEAGPINASNPCSEFMFIDDSACNLASLNLLKFKATNKNFNYESFSKAIFLFILAQDIMIDNGSYPSAAIAQNSHAYRPLGLGFSNLGAYLFAKGIPYDSDKARTLAAGIASYMTASAYFASATIASVKGSFPKYSESDSSMLSVLKEHISSIDRPPLENISESFKTVISNCWFDTFKLASSVGFRNAQVTALAPAGTISFMMDCDTTGIEPELSLVKTKQCSDGSSIVSVNTTIVTALNYIGYTIAQSKAILEYIIANNDIKGAPGFKEDDLSIFDCAFKMPISGRFLSYQAHIKMMAAIQPFISGAISKTVNVPTETSVGDIFNIYIEAWKLGLKSIAIYRDGSKFTQPLTTKKQTQIVHTEQEQLSYRKLPETRQAITHKFKIAGHKGFLTVGLYEDGSPGELFVVMAKEGSTIGGMMGAFGVVASMALQHGVSLESLIKNLRYMKFDPSGMTSNKDIPFASSIIDYIFNWLGKQFHLNEEIKESIPSALISIKHPLSEAPCCEVCQSLMIRVGPCFYCSNCGNNYGCS